MPVPEADACYGGPAGVPAHITVLYPFATEDAVDESALELLFAGFEPISFVLEGVERFSDGVEWLRPEPMEPFRALIDAVWARWPEHPPYEGTIDDPTPHVTITRAAIDLPVACRASEVVLLAENDDGGFSTLRRFRLGQGVA